MGLYKRRKGSDQGATFGGSHPYDLRALSPSGRKLSCLKLQANYNLHQFLSIKSMEYEARQAGNIHLSLKLKKSKFYLAMYSLVSIETRYQICTHCLTGVQI